MSVLNDSHCILRGEPDKAKAHDKPLSLTCADMVLAKEDDLQSILTMISTGAGLIDLEP